MRKFDLNIKANNKEWLYTQYIVNIRGLKDIAVECGTTEDSIRTRLKRFNIPIRTHIEALKIKNKKYPVHPSRKQIENANKTLDIGFGSILRFAWSDSTSFY